jgi:PPOX class probable F420-dependent enzyme
MSKAIPPTHKDLIDKPVLAYVAVTLGDHTPQVTPVWFMQEADGTLSFNTAEGRVKAKALAKTPYAALLIMDPANQFRYIAARGPVEVIPDADRGHINALCMRYTGNPVFTFGPPTEKRIKYKMKIAHLAASG